jgi:hypothetical protein
MALMMDTREAVRCLDIFSDNLVCLGLLVRSSTLENKTDKEICDMRQALKIEIMKKQKEAMALAVEIVAAKSCKSDSLMDVFGVNGAIRRYVLADSQASEALRPPPETFADGFARILEQVAAREKAAREAKQAKPVAPSADNDPAAVSPGAVAVQPSP